MALASVIVASPHPLTAEGVVGLLKDAGYKVQATIGAFNELAQAIAKDKPDMVLVDGSMLANNLEELGSLAARCTIAILVGPEKGPVLRDALMAGARGFISVDIDVAQFIAVPPGNLDPQVSRSSGVLKRAHHLRVLGQQLSPLAGG